MESIIQAIESEIGITELRLSALRRSLEALRAIPTNGTAHIMAGAEEPDDFAILIWPTRAHHIWPTFTH